MSLTNFSDAALINELQRRQKCNQIKDQKKLVLLGAPGAGKGTHAQRLIDKYCLCQISTGDMLRKEIKEKTELGKQAQEIISKGGLMPDQIVIQMVANNLNNQECKKGAILDGFPRTVNQAVAFDDILKKNKTFLNNVIYFDINDDIVTERLGGRLVHQQSGRSYHVKYNPPKVPGIDDITGEPLIQRSDDKEEVIRERLKNFHDQTIPILDYYKKQGILSVVQANSSIINVWRSIKSALSTDHHVNPLPKHPQGFLAKHD